MRRITIEAADRSLLRDEEIGEDHQEDADDEADVEVDQRPVLPALPGLLLAETHRHPFLPAAGEQGKTRCVVWSLGFINLGEMTVVYPENRCWLN